MTPRYFTVEEANELLPQIRPLVAEIIDRRGRIVRGRRDVVEFLRQEPSDIGGAGPSALVQDFIAIERLARQIRRHGCILKDLNNGLVDFLAERDGREVYLCWRFGEPRVEFFHDLHTGYMSREHL
jgi:hypothetical protein